MNINKTLVAILATFTLVAITAPASARGKPLPPAPASPPARILHMFTGNGANDATTSRLYLFGGDASNGGQLADFWYYQTVNHSWTSVAPSGTSRPLGRKLAGWSCGGGYCVMQGGLSTKVFDETWVYSEATNAWSKARCTSRTPCLSARYGSVMTFDSASGKHLLFGGRSGDYGSPPNTVFDDTYVFDAGTRTWAVKSSAHKPAPRDSAAAAYVPGLGMVLFGGLSQSESTLCDMHVWTGSDWEAIQQNGSGPCLWGHSIAWDGTHLIVVGGLTGSSPIRDANTVSYRFTFDSGARSGSWSTAGSNVTCANESGGTDATIHTHAKMAFDADSRRQVFFSGGDGFTYYDNTVECYDPWP